MGSGEMKKYFILSLSFLVLAIFMFSQQVVENPEEPSNPDAGRILKLKEELRITDEQGGFYLKNPYNIKISSDGNLFICDEDQFLRFDDKGEFLANLFRKGQGPGEFERIENYLFRDDQIIVHQSRPNKIVRMDRQGELIEEFKPETPVSKLLVYFNDTFFMGKSSFPQLKKPGGEPEIIDVDWNLINVFEGGVTEETDYHFPVKWIAKRLEKAIIANFIVDFTAVPYMKKYLVIHHTQEYLLKLFDLEKNQLVRSFSRDYKRVKRKPDKTTLKGVSPNTYTLGLPNEYHNDIQKMLVHEEKIWILTSTLEKNKGVLVDVFDKEGLYIDSFYLPLAENITLEGLSQLSLCVIENFLYIVEKDENDIPSIVKYRIVN